MADRPLPTAVQSPNVQLSPSTRADGPALSAFLQRVFRVPSTAVFLDERNIEWKYWTDREDWTGPRSFTARHGAGIVAHAAAWPVRIRLQDRVLPGAHVIDWASDPRYPGAGIWVMRQVRARTALLIATGGTETARRALPAIGFRPLGDICRFARSLRPIRQAWTATPWTWRLPAGLLRNGVSRAYPPVSPPSAWSAAPIEPDAIDESVWPAASENVAVAARDAGFYRYLLASPATRHALFGLRRKGQLVGFFCIAYARHVARIADFWVTSSTVDDWCAGFRAASSVAAQSKDVYEVTAWASTAIGRVALARAGFRLRDSSPLSVLGDVTPLGRREVHVQMVDCDASFLGADQISYLT